MNGKMFHAVAILLAACLALALPSTAVRAEDVVERLARKSTPPIGSTATAAPGEILYTEYEQKETMFAKLKSDTRVSKSGMTLPKGLLLECDLAHGSGNADCCKGYEAALYCLQDRDHNGKFDKVNILGGGKPIDYLNAPYETVWQASDSQPRWKKTLVYQGVAGGIIRVTYQEQEAATNTSQSHELSFDVAKEGNTDLVYKGLHLVITKIESSKVDYSVVSGFSEAPNP